jgi:hypothetical protein
MQNMVAGSRDDAHFLFIDRSDSKTTGKIDALITDLKLEVELERQTIDRMDDDECKEELKQLSDLLRGQQPRLRWNAKWVLAIKAGMKARSAVRFDTHPAEVTPTSTTPIRLSSASGTPRPSPAPRSLLYRQLWPR